MKNLILLFCAVLISTNIFSNTITLQCENMTTHSPQGFGLVTNQPTNGVWLYADGDQVSQTIILPEMPGQYLIEVRGASDGTAQADAQLRIGGTIVHLFQFSGTAPYIQDVEVNLSGVNEKEILLIRTQDNGSSNTFLDYFSITYIGDSQGGNDPGLPGNGDEITLQCESMTVHSPSGYGLVTDNPTNGVWLYTNGDQVSETLTLPEVPGRYRIDLRGASNNNNSAGAQLRINGENMYMFSFSGTTPVILSTEVNITGTSSSVDLLLIRTDDTGATNTFLDYITITHLGEIPPPPPPPMLPTEGAFYTGLYRNMFVEAGYTQEEVDTKINGVFDQLFYGDNATERVYYPVGNDMAYILDADNNDVRTEGMSYGMMIAVQMDKQEEFDRLWNFSKTHMQHGPGNREGYFAWVVNTDGSIRDQNTAPDGEIYFVTALYFASSRWGDGNGIYNYRAEADYILNQVMSKGWPHNNIIGSVPNMFTPDHQVVYVPYASASEFSNPSYYLPAFFEIWGMMANQNNQFWYDAADVARDFLYNAANPVTGLMPDYANYDATPRNQGDKMHFVVDAWRTIMNVAMDYSWFKKDERQKELCMRIQSFFESEGMLTYWSSYELNGTPRNGYNYQSAGLVACNAVGSLASDDAMAWEFIHSLWNRDLTTGQYRYYDGMLQMMSLLHLAGEFRAYTDNFSVNVNNPDAANRSKIDVYPNPSNGIINIDLDVNSTIEELIITDITGKKVFQSQQFSSQEINLSNLPKGIYILSARSNNAIITEKIVIK